jgi:hypothetical protein
MSTMLRKAADILLAVLKAVVGVMVVGVFLVSVLDHFVSANYA